MLIPRFGQQHRWTIVDDEHRVCENCGLRLIYYRGTVYRRGWLAYDVDGVPSPVLLMGEQAGSFGHCTPRAFTGPTVLIEYTGDPDLFPGCERILHRLKRRHHASAIAADGMAITLEPEILCGPLPTYWEVGPARTAQGWTTCRNCQRLG